MEVYIDICSSITQESTNRNWKIILIFKILTCSDAICKHIFFIMKLTIEEGQEEGWMCSLSNLY